MLEEPSTTLRLYSRPYSYRISNDENNDIENNGEDAHDADDDVVVEDSLEAGEAGHHHTNNKTKTTTTTGVNNNNGDNVMTTVLDNNDDGKRSPSVVGEVVSRRSCSSKDHPNNNESPTPSHSTSSSVPESSSMTNNVATTTNNNDKKKKGKSGALVIENNSNNRNDNDNDKDDDDYNNGKIKKKGSWVPLRRNNDWLQQWSEKWMFSHWPILLVSALVFLVLAGAGITIFFVISQSQEDDLQDKIFDLAVETGDVSILLLLCVTDCRPRMLSSLSSVWNIAAALIVCVARLSSLHCIGSNTIVVQPPGNTVVFQGVGLCHFASLFYGTVCLRIGTVRRVTRSNKVSR